MGGISVKVFMGCSGKISRGVAAFTAWRLVHFLTLPISGWLCRWLDALFQSF